ncbi:MAG: ribosome maturation factor RimM [Rickettsiales bacterium]
MARDPAIAANPDWVLLAAVAQPHGVSGRVKIKSFTDPVDDFAAHTGLCDEAGNPVKLTLTGHAQGMPVVAIEGVNDRNAAELWRGRRLGVARSTLPALPENRFYTDDLTGMDVVDAAGAAFGRVTQVANYGAGDLLDIARIGGRDEFYAFTHANFPVVDMQARRLTITPPELLVADAPYAKNSPE